MKKKKEITYGTLVKVAKNVLLTIRVEDCENFKEDKDCFFYNGVQSKIRLYGGKAPKDLKQLLTFYEMHKIRHKWLKFLYPYFKIFIPELTKEKMWKVILDRREHYIMDQNVKRKRNMFNTPQISYSYSYSQQLLNERGFQICDPMNKGRLFPMTLKQYLSFFLDMSNNQIEKFYNENLCFERRHMSIKSYEDNIIICNFIGMVGEYSSNLRFFILPHGKIYIDQTLNKDCSIRRGDYIPKESRGKV